MPSEISLLDLLLRASFLVQFVMLLLLAASLYSWTVIFQKWRLLRQVDQASRAFEKRFWSGLDLDQFFRSVTRRGHEQTLSEQVFAGGYQEFRHLYEYPELPVESGLESTERNMRATLSRHLEILDRQLPALATIGSTSPYIGLFGTVWGIMSAFQALGNVQQATLAMVAPGIAEALVATAMGLFAAIPAVIAYNRFSSGVERYISRHETFIDDLMGILERQAHLHRKGTRAHEQAETE